MLPLLHFGVVVNGYKIDKSCTKIGKSVLQKNYSHQLLTTSGPQIQVALRSAFAMARQGKAALQNGVNMGDDQAEANVPRNPELVNLIKNLFAHQDHIDDKLPPVVKPNMYRYKVNLKNLKLRKVDSRSYPGLCHPKVSK